MKNHFRLPTMPALFAVQMQDLHLLRDDIQHVTGLSAKTIQRYYNQNSAPQWLRALMICYAGFLPFDGWQGWQITEHGLTHPSAPSTKNRPITPEELKDFAYRLQEIHTLRARVEQLENQQQPLLAIRKA